MEELEQCIAGSQNPEAEVQKKELVQAINRFLDKLPIPERRVFLARYWYVDTYTVDLYALETDGNYVYSTAPWDDGHMCWELIYGDNGKPSAIRLIEEDITK